MTTTKKGDITANDDENGWKIRIKVKKKNENEEKGSIELVKLTQKENLKLTIERKKKPFAKPFRSPFTLPIKRFIKITFLMVGCLSFHRRKCA